VLLCRPQQEPCGICKHGLTCDFYIPGQSLTSVTNVSSHAVLQEEPYGIWKYWRTDARAVILGFLAVVSAIQYFAKRSAYDTVSFASNSSTYSIK